MFLLKRITVVFFAVFFAAGAFALETATVRTTLPNGKVETREIKLREVEKNVFRAEIPVREIPRDAVYIDVIADSAKAKKGDKGFYALPDGSYIEFDKDKGAYPGHRTLMPIFGFQTPKETAVAIVKGLPLEFKPTVEVKNGEYSIFPRFDIKKIEFDPYEDIVVDFYKLEGKDANYSGMARTYRDYQLSRGEVKPLKERIKNNPTLDFTANSIYVRIKFGWRDRRALPRDKWAELPMIVNNTFADAESIMKRMKADGMDNVEVCFVGWQRGGHDGPYPDLLPIPEEFGGEKGMKQAMELGKSLGYHMTVHANHHDAVKSAVRYNPLDVMWDLEGNERKYTLLPGGQVYHACFQTVYDRYLDQDIADVKALGVNGTYHVDVTTAILPRPCHNPRHPANRKIETEYEYKISKKCQEAFGAYSSEAGFDHIAGATDYVLYVQWSGTENNPLVKKMIPLWQIVYHGIILSAPYYATIDAAYPREGEKLSDSNKSFCYLGSTEARRLKLVEFGGRPAFYYTDYKDIAPVKSAYDEYMKLKRLQFEFLNSHEEIAPSVFLSKYSDGTEMLCNYTDKPYEYKGRSVKPLSYEVYDPAK